MIENYGRLAIGNQLHVIGQNGGKLIHKSSADDGKTWSGEHTIANNTNFFPMMYGGLFCQGDTVYLLTAAGNMESGPRQLDFWRSNDNGKTWSKAVRITDGSTDIYRARIVASGPYVHVAGQGDLSNGFYAYFRSEDGGKTWGDAKVLPQDVGVDRNHQEVWMTSGGDVHLCYRFGFTDEDPLGYIHSGDYGKTWDKSEIAFITPGGNHPYSICANKNGVHVLTAPQGEMKYASRTLKPAVTGKIKTQAKSISKLDPNVLFFKLFGKFLLGVMR